MAYQGISTGTGPNQGDGDTLVDGAVKINSNFQEIYTSLGDGNNLNFKDYTITTTSVDKILSNFEYCTVTSGGVTLTLPSSPSIGDRVVIGIGGNYEDTVVKRYGSNNIMGLSEDITINAGYVTLTFIYINNTLGWRIS
jgi:hypothetical protein